MTPYIQDLPDKYPVNTRENFHAELAYWGVICLDLLAEIRKTNKLATLEYLLKEYRYAHGEYIWYLARLRRAFN